MKKKVNKQNVNVFVPITMLASSWGGDFEKLPPNKIYDLLIDYPLDNPVKFKIKTGKTGMDLAKLMNTIGNLYEKVYEIDEADPNIYGIYGHYITDLNLSGINIDHNKLLITLDVDS